MIPDSFSRIPGAVPRPQSLPGELAGFRIPLAESRVLSLAPRELARKLTFSPGCLSSRGEKHLKNLKKGVFFISSTLELTGQQHRVQCGILMVILTFLLFFDALILQDTQRQ